MNSFPSSVIYSTSTIADGNMATRFGHEAEVQHNYSQWLSQLGIKNEQVCLMDCKHGAEIEIITKANFSTDSRPGCDALITAEPNMALMLLTADCLPVAYFDPVTKVIALAHLNRRNAGLGLVAKLITTLQSNFSVNPENLLLSIGPSISAASYRFSLPLTDPTPTALLPYLHEDAGFVQVDVLQCHLDQLRAVGVKASNITLSPIDTATDPNYFSHYASQQLLNKPGGRFATVIMRT